MLFLPPCFVLFSSENKIIIFVYSYCNLSFLKREGCEKNHSNFIWGFLPKITVKIMIQNNPLSLKGREGKGWISPRLNKGLSPLQRGVGIFLAFFLFFC